MTRSGRGRWPYRCSGGATASGQTPPPPAPPTAGDKAAEDAKADPKKEEKPKTFWEENTLFAYIENSFVGNLHGAGRGNRQRAAVLRPRHRLHVQHGGVQHQEGPVGELSVRLRARPDRREDAQKNHAIGIFRDEDDSFAFSNTEPSSTCRRRTDRTRSRSGSGLTLKAGKFVTLLGYEVIESPNNLNFSRSFLFCSASRSRTWAPSLAYPVDGLADVTAGTVVGWDVAEGNNGAMSFTGQFAFTPIKDLAVAFNWITGPEQFNNDTHNRTVARLHRQLHRDQEPDARRSTTTTASRTRSRSGGLRHPGRTPSQWWGIAGYGAYDWTEALRTALRGEYFADPRRVRTAARPVPGLKRRCGRRRRRSSTRSGRGWWPASSTATTRQTRRSSSWRITGPVHPGQSGHDEREPVLPVLLSRLPCREPLGCCIGKRHRWGRSGPLGNAPRADAG